MISNDTYFFNPDIFDLLLFDQRGAGRSTPSLSLEANTTAHLINDIEALRRMAGHERMVIMGPSWGSTLALAYAEAHPDRVAGLLVGGVFLGTKKELGWWHDPSGVPRFFPDAYADFISPVPVDLRSSAPEVIDWYRKAMEDEVATGMPYLKALSSSDASIDQLRKSALYRWTEYEDRLSWLECSPEMARTGMAARGVDFVASHSMIEAHYFANDCFLSPGQLITNAEKLADIPIQIIQSRYDMVCPPGAAFKLAEMCPKAELTLVPVNGHAMTDQIFPLVAKALAKLA